MQVVAHDNFKRHGDGSAAADPLAQFSERGRRPWVSIAGTWRWDRNGGTGIYSSGGGGDRIAVDSGSSDGMVETLFSALSGDNAGLCYRAAPGDGFIRVVCDSSNVYFQSVNAAASSFSNLVGAWAHGGNPTGVLRAVFIGDRHRIYKDGLPIRDFTYSGYLHNTYHGVHHRNGTGHRTGYCTVWAPDPAQERPLAQTHRGRRQRLRMP